MDRYIFIYDGLILKGFPSLGSVKFGELTCMIYGERFGLMLLPLWAVTAREVWRVLKFVSSIEPC